MKKDPLPSEFVAFIRGYVASPQFTTPRRLFRGLVFRWSLWQDGNSRNALPGYASCPPEDPRTGFPAGWSQQKFSSICRETIGTATIARGRRAASVVGPRHDCGSGQDYGICKACGRGHGFAIKLTSTH